MTRKPPRRIFTPEFKGEAIKLVLDEGRSVSSVAKNLGIYNSSLADWVKQAKIDRGVGPKNALTSAEKDEVAGLRKEIRELKMEREIQTAQK